MEAETEYNYYRTEPGKLISITPVTDADYADVLDYFCDKYVKEEPTMKLLNGSSSKSTKVVVEDIRRIVRPMLREGLCLMAQDEKTGEIMGAWINTSHTEETRSCQDLMRSVEGKMLVKLLDEARSKAKLLQELGTENYVDMFSVLISPKYREQGIATEMCRRALDLFRKKGHRHAVIECTGPIIRDMMGHMGFIELSGYEFQNLVDSSGKRVFKEKLLNRDHSVTVFAKLLHRRLSSFI